VVSISVTSQGSGYSADTVVRCPRACPVEQQKLVSSCGCGCGCGCNATTINAACEPVADFGLRVVSTMDVAAPDVAGVCSWSQDAGRLTCPVQGCMKADTPTKFEVTLKNGMSSQSGQTVNVMAGGKNPIGAVALVGKIMEIVAAPASTDETVTAFCKCDVGSTCTCTATFQNLSSTKTYALGADLQCNTGATIKTIKIAGAAKDIALVAQAPSTCTDKCSSYHRLLAGLPVAKADTTGGSLKVELETEAIVDPRDYCGSGHMFKTVFSLTPVDPLYKSGFNPIRAD